MKYTKGSQFKYTPLALKKDPNLSVGTLTLLSYFKDDDTGKTMLILRDTFIQDPIMEDAEDMVEVGGATTEEKILGVLTDLSESVRVIAAFAEHMHLHHTNDSFQESDPEEAAMDEALVDTRKKKKSDKEEDDGFN